ncbi:MAG: YceI family protein [Planctomycetaceae bacterium]
MRQMLAVVIGLVVSLSTMATAADHYAIDNDHTSVIFHVSHLGISAVHGRFDQTEGQLTLGPDGAESSIILSIDVKSLDTKVKQRDEHLLAPEFFDAEKYPQIKFKSTQVERTPEGLKVTGTVSMHGQTKPLTMLLTGGKTAEFPPGVHRIGYSTNFVLKRSDFGMKTMLGPIGDDVQVDVSFEAIRQ